MKRIWGLILCVLIAFVYQVSLADQMATTEDGRKVLLRDDGTWEYVKEASEAKEALPKGDASVPMKLAEDYRNNYEFEDALIWYERVIQDFPGTIDAGNASLNKLAILQAESGWYTQVSSDFLDLRNARSDEADKYSYGGTIYKELKAKANELDKKQKKYSMKRFQKGKALREEFHRFQKDYSPILQKLSIPYIEMYTGEMPPILYVEESNIDSILALGNEKHLEYESRRKTVLTIAFSGFCLDYMVFNGENPTSDQLESYHQGKMKNDIKPLGFYFWLGVALTNAGQHKTACKAFKNAVDAASEETSYNKVVYESEKKIMQIEKTSKQLIEYYKTGLSAQERAEIEEYLEPYTAE